MLATTKHRQGSEQQAYPFPTGRNARWHNHCGRQVEKFLTKLDILLLCDPVIMFLGIYPNDMKMYAHKKLCTGAAWPGG